MRDLEHLSQRKPNARKRATRPQTKEPVRTARKQKNEFSRDRRDFSYDSEKQRRDRSSIRPRNELQNQNRRRTNPSPSETDWSTRPRKKRVKSYTPQKHSQNVLPQSKKRGFWKVVGAILFNVLYYSVTLGMILIAILFGISANSNSSMFGYRFFTVLTNSMVPGKERLPAGVQAGFYANDVIILKDITYSQVEVNDVVTYTLGEDGAHFLTHRVVEKRNDIPGLEGDYLYTKGDANDSVDPPVKADRIIGKVVYVIPRLGYVFDFIRENFWACLVFILGLFGSLLVLKLYLFGDSARK